MTRLPILDLVKSVLDKSQVDETVGKYQSLHSSSAEVRKRNYAQLVNDYYDLATDFYELGWGQSFHFAPRYRNESLPSSIARHEMYLALKLGLRPGMNVLDVGCGIGGPMRTIARFSGCNVIGVNNNAYQISRGSEHNRKGGVEARCSFLKADFMKLPVAARSYDRVYAIEATCHAPDKVALFSELRRVMKPGAEIAGYEWCLTDRYDASNSEHLTIKKGIEEGAGLPDLWHTHEVVEALERAGFQVLESRDLAGESDPETPWYLPLTGRFRLDGLHMTAVGRYVTNRAVRALESLGVAPKGSTAVSSLLSRASISLVRGAKLGIFTPMFFFHARNPQST